MEELPFDIKEILERWENEDSALKQSYEDWINNRPQSQVYEE